VTPSLHARRFGWKFILRRGRDRAAQSWRRATAGSTLIARRDGIWHASRATRIKTIGAVASVTGSYGETPTSCDCRTRFTPGDSACGRRRHTGRRRDSTGQLRVRSRLYGFMRRRADGHAHADLFRALAHGVRHHGIEPDGGEQQRDDRERRRSRPDTAAPLWGPCCQRRERRAPCSRLARRSRGRPSIICLETRHEPQVVAAEARCQSCARWDHPQVPVVHVFGAGQRWGLRPCRGLVPPRGPFLNPQRCRREGSPLD